MMEKLYADFTSKVLPAIQEGLVITKDYFADLFSRYVKYLIVVDSATVAMCIIVAIISCVYIVKNWRKGLSPNEDHWNKNSHFDSSFSVVLTFGISVLFFVISTITGLVSAFNLAKDIYIPEVRVYEKVMELKSAPNRGQ